MVTTITTIIARRRLGAFVVLATLAGIWGCADQAADFNSRGPRQNGDADLGSQPTDGTTRPTDGEDSVSGADTPQDPGESETPDDPSNPDDPTGEEPTEPENPSEPTVLDKTFDVATFGQGSVALVADYDYIDSRVTLKRQYNDAEKNFRQDKRPWQRRDYQQGNRGEAINEQFTQNNFGVLDLLIVIDNSSSMEEEQKNLSTKLEPLLSYVQGSDWQIGVVTTDPRRGCLDRLIKKGDANAEQSFRTAIQAGTNGTGEEMGIYQARRSLLGEVDGRRCSQGSWIRPGSNVAVLIVADEDNCSDGNDCRGRDYQSETYLTDYLASIRTLGEDAKVYGIFWDPNVPKSQCPVAENPAKIYYRAVKATGGTYGSICDADYTETLKAISQDVYQSLKIRYTLKTEPSPGTLKVTVGNVDWTKKVDVDGTMLTFKMPPTPGSMIDVSYRHGATTILDRFAASDRADPKHLKVSVNGTELSTDEYTFDAKKGEVKLAEAPADLATVTIEYREKGGLKKSFDIGTKARAASVKVYVDEELASDARYDQATGLVTFAEAPMDDAAIRVSYDEPGDPILSYPFKLGEDEARHLVAFAADDPTAAYMITFDPAAETVTFAADEFAEGQAVVLRYRDPDSRRQAVKLPHPALEGTLSIDVGSSPCRPDEFAHDTVMQQVVTDCELGEGAKIKISYVYLVKEQTAFTLAGVKNPAKAQWEVWVDDEPTAEWVRVDSNIHVTRTLDLKSRVRIRATMNQ